MQANTRLFGEIDIEEEKLIRFPEGIIGFPDLKIFTLIFDEEKTSSNIMWLQSMDEPTFAMPVMNPLLVVPEYNPIIDEEAFRALGTLTEENTLCFTTVTVPSDIKDISINLKAPIIINSDERKARQVILEEDYEIKFKIFDILSAAKEGA